ncbi:hypothetical protein QCB49_11085 (plasmid) [Cetobacterium somerae]|uniref:hypothetical protein n=1 Tax=Cetobacterium somerae TaxID=188913 RepID=UPI00389138BD
MTNNINEDPTNLYEFNQSGLKIGIDYQALNTSNGGIDFVLMEWHGKAKTSIIKVEYPDGAISNYTLNIPEFEGKNYYNEKLPLANEYLLTKKYTKEINSFIGGDLRFYKAGNKKLRFKNFRKLLSGI